ncbi:hypothetical protein OV208_07910 [Corallococcus sp. bb12-1]|uniref:hypothetical protein n=1 Tax=Corallococcus sp. bb12-1 TaxID=2996784 RepID=UPI002271E100|nr:hypothetical protein [Corallococcus sp. bb12-1]MCY1041241.1 hypothetical protein [Corallococcus sp. bb12-1]
MGYYWNVMALSVGVVFCFVLGRALFESVEPAPAVARVKPSPARHADAGHLPRK